MHLSLVFIKVKRTSNLRKKPIDGEDKSYKSSEDEVSDELDSVYMDSDDSDGFV